MEGAKSRAIGLVANLGDPAYALERHAKLDSQVSKGIETGSYSDLGELARII